MFYLIKDLKWTRYNKYDTWWQPNSNGYTNRICNAGVYTDEDKDTWGKTGIEYGHLEFVPLAQELLDEAEKQVIVEIDKLKKWLKRETENLENIASMRSLISN